MCKNGRYYEILLLLFSLSKWQIKRMEYMLGRWAISVVAKLPQGVHVRPAFSACNGNFSLGVK